MGQGMPVKNRRRSSRSSRSFTYFDSIRISKEAGAKERRTNLLPKRHQTGLDRSNSVVKTCFLNIMTSLDCNAMVLSILAESSLSCCKTASPH